MANIPLTPLLISSARDSEVPYGQELLHEGIAEKVVSKVHCEGHQGVNHMWRQVQLQYTSPRLFELVCKVVQECITCQVQARKIRRRYEPARPITTLVHPFYMITRDANAQDRWDEFVNSALLILQVMVNDSTGHSPSTLLLGYSIRTSAIWPARRTDFVEGEALDEIADRVIQQLTNGLCEAARQKTKDRQLQDKQRYDMHVGMCKRFVVGEQVLMRDNKPVTKLQDRWLGPMVVTQINKNNTYLLVGPNYLRLQGAVNGDSLVPFIQH
ncbi:hypothetical protein F4703DRAFT_1798595 [Phycomyces blakesleeanus]